MLKPIRVYAAMPAGRSGTQIMTWSMRVSTLTSPWRLHEAVAQARAHAVHDHDHRDGHEEHRRGGGVVDHAEVGLEVEADAPRADEAEHGGRADVGLEAIEDVGQEERQDLGPDAQTEDLDPRPAGGRERVDRAPGDPPAGLPP